MRKIYRVVVTVVVLLFCCLCVYGADRYVDNGDGTVTDVNTGLMWAQKDSCSDTGQCMDWNHVREYIAKLRIGGYDDWRIPTIEQYKTIYNPSFSVKGCLDKKEGKMANLHFSPIFARGGAGWYWSSDEVGHDNMRVFFFATGKVYKLPITIDFNRDAGVRAVRLANIDR